MHLDLVPGVNIFERFVYVALIVVEAPCRESLQTPTLIGMQRIRSVPETAGNPSVSFAHSCFEPHGPTFELLFVRKFGVLVVERRKLGLVGARGISIRHGDLTEPART